MNDKCSLIDVRDFTDFWGKQKFQVECYLQNPPLEPWHFPSLLRVIHAMMALQHVREFFNSLLAKLKLFDKWDTYHPFIQQCLLKLWSLTESSCKAFAFAFYIYTHTHTHIVLVHVTFRSSQDIRSYAFQHRLQDTFQIGGKYAVCSRWCSGKEASAKAGDADPWVGKIPWRRKWQPNQYSCLENSMDRGTWWATVHVVAKSQTWLSTHCVLVANKQADKTIMYLFIHYMIPNIICTLELESFY